MRYNAKYPAKWRKYQAGLQKNTERKHSLKRLSFLLTIAGGLLTVLAIFLLAGFRNSDHWSQADQNSAPSEKDLNATQFKLTRKDLAVFLTDITGKPLALGDQIVHKNVKITLTGTLLAYQKLTLENSDGDRQAETEADPTLQFAAQVSFRF